MCVCANFVQEQRDLPFKVNSVYIAFSIVTSHSQSKVFAGEESAERNIFSNFFNVRADV